MVRKIPPLIRLINPLNFLQKTDFKLKQWLQQRLTPKPKHSDLLLSPVVSTTHQFLDRISKDVPAKYINSILLNIPRLNRIDRLSWLQLYTVSPPMIL
jgi:hypothetical protein